MRSDVVTARQHASVGMINPTRMNLAIMAQSLVFLRKQRKAARMQAKLLVTLAQIVGSAASNLGVTFPPIFSSCLAVLNVVNFDFLPSLNLGCVIEFSYIRSLIIATSWPLVVTFVLLVVLPTVEVLRRGKSYQDVLPGYVTPFLYLTFMIYISTCKTLFSYFMCHCLVDTKECWLEEDYSFECYVPEYNRFKWFVWLMILVYPIGIPCVYLGLMWPVRRILSTPEEKRTRKNKEKVAYIEFIADTYIPALWYFEIIECFRRLCLSSVLGAISKGTPTQSLLGVAMALASLALFVHCRQYPTNQLNLSGELAQWLTAFTFLYALIKQLDVSEAFVNERDAWMFGTCLFATRNRIPSP